MFILVGRGSGKNAYLAYEDFCLITPTHGIKNYDIDISANSEDQAKTTFLPEPLPTKINKSANLGNPFS